MKHPLDNVIWQALNTCQSHLGRNHQGASKFLKDVSVLGGFRDPGDENYELLAPLVDPGERVGLFLQSSPSAPGQWTVAMTIPLLQMICDNGDTSTSRSSHEAIVQLGEEDVPDMIALTKLTKPGPFGTRTREMGDYFGIRREGKLIAMAGERLRLPGYTEISAVCTHPDHLGHGYATRLMALLIERIQKRSEQAFLHVRADNARAISLYERLGFRRRAESQYVILSKNS